MAKRVDRTEFVSESQHSWWRSARGLAFMGAAGFALVIVLKPVVTKAIARDPKTYTATTTQFSCTVATLYDAPVLAGATVSGEAHVSCSAAPRSVTLQVELKHRPKATAAWEPAGSAKSITGTPRGSAAVYVFDPAPCAVGDFEYVYTLSGVGVDGSKLSYAPVTSTSVLSVVTGECQ